MEEFKDRLLALRKGAALTQEALAQRLGVTYQAVSKWETGSCYPDVTLLPKIAAAFGTTIDYLLGGGAPPASPPIAFASPAMQPAPPAMQPAPPAEQPEAAGSATDPSSADAAAPQDIVVDVPGDLEIRVFCKGRPVGDAKAAGEVRVVLVGRARDVRCEASLVCEEIEGDVSVGGSLDCKGDIGGDVSVGGSLRVKGDIDGDVQVTGSLECYGDIEGDVSAQKVTAGEIGGDVSATEVVAGEIGGDVVAPKVRRRTGEDE